MDEATRISLKDQFNSLLVRATQIRRGVTASMELDQKAAGTQRSTTTQ